MYLNQTELETLISNVVKETATQLGLLEKVQALGVTYHSDKTAYQKTEQLLYNYNNFKRIVREKEEEIEEIKRYGVPKRGGSVHTYAGGGGTVQGIRTVEETVDDAIRNVQASVEGTVQAICMINEGLEKLKYDPYYKILEMRYFEGRTQEDIALELKCTQKTISVNKNRLIRELSLRLFPDQVAREMMR